MARQLALVAAGISILLAAGCTHHSVRVEAMKDPTNRLIVVEEVRPWPATMHQQVEILLPPGDYTYDPRQYDVQTNLPEKPIRTLKHSEFTLRERNNPVTGIDDGWIAIFRDGVEIQLLWGGHPASFNGRYRTKVPFIHPKQP